MHKKGFTLVELSIVIVIIGLIIGGVVAGRDMVANARLRALTSEIDKYRSAYNTFLLKYNCVAGDCATAGNLGLNSYYGSAFGPNGNGDGKITCLTGSCAEGFNFIIHLYDAKLVKEQLWAWNAAEWKGMPSIGRRSFFLGTSFFSSSGYAGLSDPEPQNYLYIGYLQDIGVNTLTRLRGVLLPSEAYYLDSKTDDGLPMSGKMRASYVHYGCSGVTPTANLPCYNTPTKWSQWGWTGASCVNDSVTPNVYDVTHDKVMNTGTANDFPCSVHIPF